MTDEKAQNDWNKDEKNLSEHERYCIFQNGDRRKKKFALRNVIGSHRYYVFDGKPFFLIDDKINENDEDVDSKEFDDEYIVRFHYNQTFQMSKLLDTANDDEKNPVITSEPERMYNLINRVRLEKASFKKYAVCTFVYFLVNNIRNI